MKPNLNDFHLKQALPFPKFGRSVYEKFRKHNTKALSILVRYVHIFIIWNGTNRQTEKFFNYTNKMNNKKQDSPLKNIPTQ